MNAAAPLDSIIRDIRFGGRVLWRDRTAMSAAALSLALALGACSTAFGLIDALLLRPLSVRDPAHLFYLEAPAVEQDGFSYPLFQRLRNAAPDMHLFGANWSAPLQPVIFDAASGERELVHIAAISGSGFRALRVRAARGRLLDEFDEARAARSPAAVISHSLWMRRFGGEASVIGRRLIAGDRAFEIVGVVERSYAGLEPGYRADIWIPLTAMFYGQGADARRMARPDLNWIGVWGWSHPGDAGSREALRAAFTNFRRDHAAELTRRDWPRARARRFLDARLEFHSAPSGADSLFRRMFRRPLWIFGIFSGLLLLIAASNVANLFLARAAARDREMAMRIALGAARSRLLRQLLIESALLAAIASVAAVAASAVAAPFLAARLGASVFPAWLDLRPDWRLACFMVLAGFAITLFFGMVPALRASSTRPDAALKTGARQSAATASLRPLIPVQVAFSFMALFAGGLFLVSFEKLSHVNPGFSPDHLLLFTINTRGLTPAEERTSALELRRTLGRIAGVRSVSLSQQAPVGGPLGNIMRPFLRFPGHGIESVRPTNLPASPGFFATLGIPLLAGREFEDRDADSSAPVPAIVNRAFVERFFPHENPLGRRFEQIGDDRPVEQQIVGVVANSLYNNLREGVQPAIYTPLRFSNGATVEVRTAGDPRALAAMLRRAIESTHPGLRVRSSTLETTRIADTLVSERLLALLGGFFAITAVLLAAIGLHGVLRYFVTRRRNEIGIRMALGAQRTSIVSLMLLNIAIPLLVGVVAGAGGGIALARYARSLLFEVTPVGFQTLAAPALCLCVACAVAALRPALEAARTDPAAALRCE